ncbi:MAG: hypothetical protein E7291_06465 [Lachnospiraceae bacterium]|nr:hypothetical protein [Lachnospiraceae bacterium]
MWEKLLGLLISETVVLVTLRLLLGIARKDREMTDDNLRFTCCIGVMCLLFGEMVFFSVSHYNVSEVWVKLGMYIVMGMLAGCLLMACITDYRICMVHCYVWWVAGVAGVILLAFSCKSFFSNPISVEQIIKMFCSKFSPLLIFGLLQEKLFGRMYGKADCHAFLVCAMAECAVGMGIEGYLIHMLLSVLALAVVQGIKGNIGNKGNLKKPVPFLPYITGAFWTLMLIAA